MGSQNKDQKNLSLIWWVLGCLAIVFIWAAVELTGKLFKSGYQVPAQGLLAYYSFDSGAPDSSVGNPEFVAGVHGKALRFDGKTYVYVKNPPDGKFNLGTGDFTLSCWINTTASTVGNDWARDDIVALGDPYNSGIAISSMNNRAAAFVGSTGRQGYSQESPVVNDGRWHYLVVSRQSGVVYLYVDNGLRHKYDFSGDVTVTSDLFIGRHGTKDICYFEGLIDEVTFYNRSRSQQEIAAEFNGFVPR